MLKAVVLYEDQLADPRLPFAPHDLVLQCLADRIGGEYWQLRDQVSGKPRKGIGALKNDLCSSEGRERWAPRGEQLVFVADSDRVGDHFNLSRDSQGDCDTICREILVSAGSPAGVSFYLVVRNMETLVAEAARLVGDSVPDKGLKQRDAMLKKLMDPSRKAMRDELVRSVRMLEEIVGCLQGALATS